MNLRILDASPFDRDHEIVAVPAFAGETAPTPSLPTQLAASYEAAVKAGSFRGKPDDELWLAGVVVLGMGAADECTPECVRTFAGRAVRAAERRRRDSLAVVLPAAGALPNADAVRALAEGLVLASWDFRDLKTGDPAAVPPLVAEAAIWTAEPGGAEAERTALALGVAAARGENFARRLQSLPGNRMTPTLLAEAAAGMAKRVGIQVEIWGPERLKAERMHALLSVSMGSDQEPRLIIFRYDGGSPGDAPVALVGKGLTFDAGGISIKPAAGMEDMKYDMSGGAAVIGAMQAIAEARLPINVLGVVPSSENLLNGRANKPGDVIDSRAGKTIEVINTDAEGRLILADALAWTVEQGPSAVVDCATLTGACVIALGHHASALFSEDEALRDELCRAGERSGERCWPLPLWDVYRKQLDSAVADLKNVGGRPGGSITAARFLKEFVGETAWAHLDIAGTAYGTEPASYQRKGAFGVPTRLLFEWVRSRSA